MNSPFSTAVKSLAMILPFLLATSKPGIAQRISIYPTEIIYPVAHDISPKLVDIPIIQPDSSKSKKVKIVPNHPFSPVEEGFNILVDANAGLDPVLQSEAGDYSSLTVDPVDDRTFWYTNEYYASTSSYNWRTRVASFSIDDFPVGTKETQSTASTSLFNLKNYPNPVKSSTIISWQMKTTHHCDVRVYNAMGMEIKTLIDGDLSTGNHQLTFDASALPAGVYLYQIKAGGEFEIKKMVICK